MALIRKAAAGSDSYGHVWPEDGATVEIDDPEQIASLMAIPDGGFSEVIASDDDAGDDPQQDPEGKKDPADEDPDAKKEISEINPNAPANEPDDKPAAKKTAARKTTASKPVQE